MAILHVAWYDRMYNLMRLAIPSANLHPLSRTVKVVGLRKRSEGSRGEVVVPFLSFSWCNDLSVREVKDTLHEQVNNADEVW
jgi:hypothetical protein